MHEGKDKTSEKKAETVNVDDIRENPFTSQESPTFDSSVDT